MLHEELTQKIISAFYKVYNALGYGFLEKVYENAMAIELEKNGLDVVKQKNLKVFYDNRVVGDYFADMFVNDSVIVELKAAKELCEEHEAQLVNYLKASKIEVGLLLNFGKEPKFKRKIFESRLKKNLSK